jgi:hypothetical protein
LAEARALAAELPCALLDVREAQSPGRPNRWLVSGAALPGPALESFLRHLDGPDGPAQVVTERLDQGYCPVLAVVADLVRRTRGQGGLRLVPQTSPAPVGGHLQLNVRPVADGALYVDLFAADGSVQHLRHGPVGRNQDGANVPVTALVSGSPGVHLLVALATPAPLALDRRPVNERDTDYLPALRRELGLLGQEAPEVRAEAIPLTIAAAARPPSVAPVAAAAKTRVSGRNDARCADITAQVQLGVGLSEADRLILQTSCGR